MTVCLNCLRKKMIKNTVYDYNYNSEFKNIELLINNNQFTEALNKLSPMFSTYKKTDDNNFLCKLFDLYLLLNSFNEAEEILDYIKLNHKNKTEEEEFQTRLALLNTKENLKYNLIITNLNSSIASLNNIVDLVIPEAIKGKELSKYKIDVSIQKNNKTAFVVEYFSSHSEITNLSVIPHKIISDTINRYEIIVNILNIKRIGIQNVDNSIEWLFLFDLKEIRGVIRGRYDWLFLNNDYNQSIKQFKGEYLISQEHENGWKIYLDEIKKHDNYFFIIAPSKESVFPQFYPFDKGQIRPIDQLLKLIKDSQIKYSYPIEESQADPTSYCKTETHWSMKSADGVVLDALSQLGIDLSDYKSPLSFRPAKWLGDLGSKCDFPEYDSYLVYDNTVKEEPVFTNALPVRGTIKKFINPNSFLDKTIVIFGGSSIFACLQTFLPIFRKIVIVWSHATIINEIISYEKADYVLLQTNERFIVKSPKVVDKISDCYLTVRTNKLSEQTINFIINYKSNPENGIYNTYMLNYQKLLKPKKINELPKPSIDLQLHFSNIGWKHSNCNFFSITKGKQLESIKISNLDDFDGDISYEVLQKNGVWLRSSSKKSKQLGRTGKSLPIYGLKFGMTNKKYLLNYRLFFSDGSYSQLFGNNETFIMPKDMIDKGVTISGLNLILNIIQRL